MNLFDMKPMTPYRVVKSAPDAPFKSEDILWISRKGNICCAQNSKSINFNNQEIIKNALNFEVVRTYDWEILVLLGNEICKRRVTT